MATRAAGSKQPPDETIHATASASVERKIAEARRRLAASKSAEVSESPPRLRKSSPPAQRVRADADRALGGLGHRKFRDGVSSSRSASLSVSPVRKLPPRPPEPVTKSSVVIDQAVERYQEQLRQQPPDLKASEVQRLRAEAIAKLKEQRRAEVLVREAACRAHDEFAQAAYSASVAGTVSESPVRQERPAESTSLGRLV
eukprot:TRINITY_DN3072_c0_g1_i1.p1 TRINITY_DN3072_c0_g1~~TRINITY_DN3072_c0_g1_i1.p1  ORF type:complete len:200 (+),score=30.60 TRINITY_DN3072_c0_g1_i1:211-810(+)